MRRRDHANGEGAARLESTRRHARPLRLQQCGAAYPARLFVKRIARAIKKIARGKRRTIGGLNFLASATKRPSSATTWRLWYHDARVSLAPRGRTRGGRERASNRTRYDFRISSHIDSILDEGTQPWDTPMQR
jgi:hypothetical protein